MVIFIWMGSGYLELGYSLLLGRKGRYIGSLVMGCVIRLKEVLIFCSEFRVVVFFLRIGFVFFRL